MKYRSSTIVVGLIPFLQASEITWDVTASGGSESSGGPYSITDTIGEPLAGSASQKSEAFGFWSFLHSAPKEPQILITPLAGGQIEVSWFPAKASWVLSRSSNLKEWKTLTSSSPWTGTQTSHDFFRLQFTESK